jgi:hypothetical protein
MVVIFSSIGSSSAQEFRRNSWFLENRIWEKQLSQQHPIRDHTSALSLAAQMHFPLASHEGSNLG